MAGLGKRVQTDAPLWEDPDDEAAQVDLSQEARLRKVMRKSGKNVVDGKEYQDLMKDQVMGRLNGLQFIRWADTDKELTPEQIAAKEKGLDTLLASSQLQKTSDMPLDMLLIKKACENSHQDKLASVVQTLHCHPDNDAVFLAAGFDKTVKVFNVKFNNQHEVFELPVAKTVFMKDFPVRRARFAGGDNLVLSSIHQSLAFYNLQTEKTILLPSLFSHKGLDRKAAAVAGFEVSPGGELIAAFSANNVGNLSMVSNKTKQALFELTMNEGCVDVCFGRNSHELVTAGDRGFVYIWDLRKRGIVNKFKDHGSQTTSALAANSAWLFTGSKAGYVNLYSFETGFGAKPDPIKKFDNLTTEITQIRISPDGSKALFSSKWQKNSLRMADLNSKTIFKNWPNFKTNLGIISQAAFSCDNSYVVLGNDKGKVIVYRLGVEDQEEEENKKE
jgi:U3 small nucleolar RNA-associated protein 18